MQVLRKRIEDLPEEELVKHRASINFVERLYDDYPIEPVKKEYSFEPTGEVEVEMESSSEEEVLQEEVPSDAFQDLEVKAEETGKKFRVNHDKFFLTYKTHIPKKDLVKELRKLVKGRNNCKATILKYYVSHENGTRNPQLPYKHTHILFSLDGNKESGTCRVFDYHGIHPHIQAVRNWYAVLTYLKKEDKDPYTNIKEGDPMDIIIEQIITAPTDLDAVKQAKKINDIPAILQVRGLTKDTIIISPQSREDMTKVELLKWQKYILELIDETRSNPLNREVYYVFGYEGNFGKTVLAKWSAVHRPDLCIVRGGKSGNNNYILSNHALKFDNQLSIVIYDISRACVSDRDFWSQIEEVKDGFFVSQKYTSRVHHMRPPGILIFSNFPPDVKMLSSDRWRIFHVRNNDLESITIGEAEKMYKQKIKEDRQEENDRSMF